MLTLKSDENASHRKMHVLLNVIGVVALILLILFSSLVGSVKIAPVPKSELPQAAKDAVEYLADKGMLYRKGQQLNNPQIEQLGKASFSGRFGSVNGSILDGDNEYTYGVLFWKAPFADLYFCDVSTLELDSGRGPIIFVAPKYGLIRYHANIGPNSLVITRSLYVRRLIALIGAIVLYLTIINRHYKKNKSV